MVNIDKNPYLNEKKMARICKLCGDEVKGRSDKVFCSNICKSTYHSKLNKVTNIATERIDKILHRNRSILLEIMGKNSKQKKVSREELDNRSFHFTYITHHHINKHGKFVSYVYDFSWIIFSDQEVLIVRVGGKK